MNMKRIILNSFEGLLSCFLLLLAGCSPQAELTDSDILVGEPVEMRLQINAPLGSYAADRENVINRLRMVVFGSMSSPDAGKLILNKYYAQASAGDNLVEIITSGKRDIYLIVNEPLSGSGSVLDTYKNITTVADMRNLALTYRGAGSVEIYTPDEIPMFIKHIDQPIRVNSRNVISGAVERTMAKVTVKLNVKNSNFPTGKSVVIDNLIIRNLPEKSYLLARNYTSALVSSEKQNVKVTTPPSGYQFASANTFYVPEYILTNPAKGAYIEITGHVKDDPYRINTWKIQLGDAMDDAKMYGDRYDITRNRYYTFTGDVKSYGQMNDLAVKVNVLPWTTVNMDEESGRFVGFTKAVRANGQPLTEDLTLSFQKNGNIYAEGDSVKFYCTTNVGGWYTVIRDKNKKIIGRSPITPQVTTITEQYVTVKIPALGTTLEQSYTVDFYHPTFASETIGSLRTFRFTQVDGFIPNWKLEAYGWATPATGRKYGLEIAKKGNVLRTQVALASDPRVPWGPDGDISVNQLDFGFGKSNTETLQALGSTYAANLCEALGPEWYLPSQKEIYSILRSSVEFLGPSYSIDWWYWSSSSSDSDKTAWCTGTGGLTIGFRYQPYGVRCVRDI